MTHLHVVSARHDIEAAVSPAVPDRREEHVAVGAVGREDGDEGTLEQPVEVVGVEALSHGGESSQAWHVDIADAVTATRARSLGMVLWCAECGAESDELATGWRAFLGAALDEDEQEAELLMFCPACAEREFGPFGWEPEG